MIDLTLDSVYPIRVITGIDSPVIIAKIEKYRTMKQRRDRGVLFRTDEDSSKAGIGDNFWHAIYKGIEDSQPESRQTRPQASLQAPRDYVEDRISAALPGRIDAPAALALP